MEKANKEKLVIDGNAIYEIDMECWEKKQRRSKPHREQKEEKKK